MSRITSITITNTSCGLCSTEEILRHITTVYRTGKIKHSLYNGLSATAVKEYGYNVDKQQCEAFFIFLSEEVKIDGWMNDYSVPVCDGWSWSMLVRYSDHSVKKICGTVEPPPNGETIEKTIRKLVRFKKKAWLFSG
ncbi:hypothetical protein [Ferviditalea candida]|uniref:Uncharacterized protein n=1 Tax=Ferviditalea candida TaxID=3108399 RepID=A0ABU5ZPY3_9BACL|nr:hypothetical protein [Paenibacillaceae bacterium T2]